MSTEIKQTATASKQEKLQENNTQEVHNQLRATSQKLQAIMDNVDCGIVVMSTLPDGNIGTTYVNEGICRMMNTTPEQIIKMTEDDIFTVVHPKERAYIQKKYYEAIKEKRNFSETYRISIDGEHYIWVRMQTNLMEDENGNTIYYCVYTDVTKEKEAQDKIKISDAVVRIAVEQTGIVFGTMDLQTREITFDGTAKDHSYYMDMKFWRKVQKFIHPDDVRVITRYFKAILEGEINPPVWVRMKNADHQIYNWFKITYTLLPDENGKPVKAVISAVDVTEQKQLEEAFEDQMSFRNVLEDKVLDYYRLNLTQNTCGQGYSSNNIKDVLLKCDSADTFIQKASSFIPDESQIQEYRNLFSRENMLKQFYSGRNHLYMQRKTITDSGEIKWIETHVTVMKNPKTGDIEALVYTFDIDDSKTMQQLFDQVVNMEYDYISTIDLIHNVYRMYSHGTEDSLPGFLGCYTDIRDKHAQEYVSEGTRQEYLLQLDCQNMKKRLDKEQQYGFTFEIIAADGSCRLKEIQLRYIDRAAELVSITRRDVTEILAEEQKKAEMLRSTMHAASQASAAKSDFLSRMSHEIRTPMNAIIGMTAIAAKSVGDDERIADCLSKIGISSRFLLTLINDILDMSRIESGKVLLKNEKIPFEEFINGINAICYAQAQAKGVDYENIIDSQLDDCYIGDAMKLQQILINILSNAIKFTPQDGKVAFWIREKKRVRDNVVIEFVITDTGCGMSEDFIPKLFEPFEQEHSGSTSLYGGTGLGMAICKNFVDLMDGHIHVRSVLGHGSEFTVDVKLGITNDSIRKRNTKQTYEFSNLTALVVDDDISVCEQMVVTLKEIGIISSWVDSGKQAIDVVKRKMTAGRYFDFILIDWKMPELDGIETARRIRKIVGPDVTIIIITAYDWMEIEREAKLAGVNMLVSKPLFKSSLISAFQKSINQREEINAEEEAYDFSGKRVLLAEDHPMNAEIAEFMLKDKGMEVDWAENGVRAVELFTLSEPGYYDAILMDIRMPIMDGLQATLSIRNLNKKDAKKIPIIAMTADAFSDDMEKTKRAGMNAHLTKPIDPDALYSTLNNFIFQEKV